MRKLLVITIVAGLAGIGGYYAVIRQGKIEALKDKLAGMPEEQVRRVLKAGVGGRAEAAQYLTKFKVLAVEEGTSELELEVVWPVHKAGNKAKTKLSCPAWENSLIDIATGDTAPATKGRLLKEIRENLGNSVLIEGGCGDPDCTTLVRYCGVYAAK